MIRNLRELQDASYRAYYATDVRSVNHATHKIKSTLLILDDRQFNFTIDELKACFELGAKPDEMRSKILRLNYFAESIIKTLRAQLRVLAVDNVAS
jgi:hypothetical protein